MRSKLVTALAILAGGFVFYTSATGPFESLIQRAIFLAAVVLLGLAIFPLREGRRWRPLGLAIDLAAGRGRPGGVGARSWEGLRGLSGLLS